MVAAELNRTEQRQDEKADSAEKKAAHKQIEPLKSMTERHHPYIVELIADSVDAEVDDIVDFEMLLYDTQKSCIGGINNELIFSARLDNLMMSFCGLTGLIKSVLSPSSLEDEPCIRILSLFDHEEIGSQTAQGADSNLLPSVIFRLTVLDFPSEKDTNTRAELETTSGYEQSLATSVLLSADMAHAVHPNYPTKYESDHRPEMNQGVVVKINANARYATNSPGIVLLQEVARRAEPSDDGYHNDDPDGVPLQLFVVRNDSRCGSTIGPMLAAALGARTVDLGNPQLSMHSIRETGGVYDVEHAIRLFDSFYRNFAEVESKIVVD